MSGDTRLERIEFVARLSEPVIPVTVAKPAVRAPKLRRSRRIFVSLMLLGGAFVCGLAATVTYVNFVEIPAVANATLHRPTPSLLPPPEPLAKVVIDPMVQIMSAIRPELPAHAIAELSVTREGPVAFLEGRADSRRTVALIAEAVGRLAEIQAVDTRRVELVTRTHHLASGETLTKIARQYYGRGTDWPRLIEANPEIDKDRLRVGLELSIPPIDR